LKNNPQTYGVSVRPWLHSDMHFGFLFLDPGGYYGTRYVGHLELC